MDEIKEIISWLLVNKAAIIPIVFSLIGVATSISKLTPNETDNKYVAIFAKFWQAFAVHATPTKIIKK